MVGLELGQFFAMFLQWHLFDLACLECFKGLLKPQNFVLMVLSGLLQVLLDYHLFCLLFTFVLLVPLGEFFDG